MRWIFTRDGKQAYRTSDGVILIYDAPEITSEDDPGFPRFQERALRALRHYSQYADAMHLETNPAICIHADGRTHIINH